MIHEDIMAVGSARSASEHFNNLQSDGTKRCWFPKDVAKKRRINKPLSLVDSRCSSTHR